jgi:hypothetical protein
MSDSINFSKIDSKVQSFINDQYISSSIILFLVFYTCMIAPKLPPYVAPLMNSQIFNLFILMSICYLATKNYTIGIVASIAYFVTFSTIQKHELSKQLLSQDLLQDAIEEGRANAQIIAPTVKCGEQQLSSEQIEQIKQIKRLYEQEQEQVQGQGQQNITEQILRDDNNNKNTQENNIISIRSDININDRLSNRNFDLVGMQSIEGNTEIVGNCTRLNNLEGLPLNY